MVAMRVDHFGTYFHSLRALDSINESLKIVFDNQFNRKLVLKFHSSLCAAKTEGNAA